MLSSGVRIGPYEIVSSLGAGGMGEVYRARDTRLKRDVAIKIVPDPYSADADRLARFEREAQTLAALSHPHIAQVYGLEITSSAAGREQHALVMELVEGEDLSERLTRGPIPLAEALPIARQIADALEAAHEQGIIHRDLKPANIKLRRDGTVKVLDFGLAKLAETSSGAGGPGSGSQRGVFENSPTITSPAMTIRGMILGTAAYMSPEQARGAIVDRRADIWAFGCVLFEMLTGRRTFDDDTVTDIIASVLRKDIDWARLPAETPDGIRQLLRRCLTRDPRTRLRDIGEARISIEEAIANPSPPAAPAPATPRASNLVRTGLGVSIVVAVAATALATWLLMRPQRPSAPAVHATLELGDGVTALSDSTVALSPDSTTIAFVGRKGSGALWQLYLRRLNERDARAIAGTEGAVDPFFSPDGRSVGFFAAQKIKTVAIGGGVVTTLADAAVSRGGSWSEDGFILYSPIGMRGGVVMRVPAAGGEPQPVTALKDNEVTNRWPQVLPQGKGVLYTAHSQTGTYDAANLVVSSLAGDRREIVLRGGYHGRYLASGHLAYIHKGTLFVVPFDLDRLATTGMAMPLVENVTSDPTSGKAVFDFSRSGALVYSLGPGRDANFTISWIDEKGVEQPLRPEPGDYNALRFSPDGRHLAMDVGSNWGDAAIWTYDWARGDMARLTRGNGEDTGPVWSPDGKWIAFAAQRDGAINENIFVQRADGSAPARRLVPSDTPQLPWSWHPSGRLLAFQTSARPEISDIGIVPLQQSDSGEWEAGQPKMILSEPFVEGLPMFSPDGKWLAYTTVESGQAEVYVRPFPGLQSRTKISAEGGYGAMWSPAKPELFYAGIDGAVWAVSFRAAADEFFASKPRRWAPPGTMMVGGFSFFLHPDGKRIAFLKGTAPPERQHMALIQDAFGEVRRVFQAATK